MMNAVLRNQGIRMALAALAATACVAGTSAANVPDGYQRLEWIQSDGQQFLNVGTIPAGADTELEIYVGQMEQLSTAMQTIFSQGRTSWGNYHLNLRKSTLWNSAAWQSGSAGSSLVGTYRAGDDVRIAVTKEHVVIDNGTDAQTFDFGLQASSGNLYLFADTAINYNPAHLRFYGLTIKEGGAVVRDFVPCVRTLDQKPGVFDLAHVEDGDKAFYVNAYAKATTDFTCGPAFVSGFELAEVPPQVHYAPGSHMPVPVVTDKATGEVLSAEGFEWSYKNNSTVGTATVTATGKDGTDYAGLSASREFFIVPVCRVAATVGTEGDGGSWESPMSVSNALVQVSLHGGEIWLKEGEYVPAESLPVCDFGGEVRIIGGFSGTEAMPEDRADGLVSAIDGGHTNGLISFSNDVSPVLVDRIRFMRSAQSALTKTGKRNLTVRECEFYCNGNPDGEVNGRGLNVAGSGASKVLVENCTFGGNRLERHSTQFYISAGYGCGICAKDCAALSVSDSLFASNGVSNILLSDSAAYFTTRSYGAAIYAENTLTTVCRTRFAGNFTALKYHEDTPQRAKDGGIVVLRGNSGGSSFTNCCWVGNGGWNARQPDSPQYDGALVVDLANSADTVSVRSSTFAYNVTQGRYCPGGLNVAKGTVNVEDSIFFANRSGGADIGCDVAVKDGGVLVADYTSFTGTNGTYVSEAVSGSATFGPNVLECDPLFVSSTNDFAATLAASGFFKYDAESAAAITGFNVHLRSAQGYVDECLGTRVRWRRTMSPAIDKGNPASDYGQEPQPNGKRINLGFYGNTPYASCSGASGLMLILR